MELVGVKWRCDAHLITTCGLYLYNCMALIPVSTSSLVHLKDAHIACFGCDQERSV